MFPHLQPGKEALKEPETQLPDNQVVTKAGSQL